MTIRDPWGTKLLELLADRLASASPQNRAAILARLPTGEPAARTKELIEAVATTAFEDSINE
jgi:hypothetical protein